MGYRLQMSAEIYDWLAELRGSDPPAAALAAQALAALAADGDRLGPPLVTAVEGRLRPDELLPALDRRYQAGLESVTAMRRRVAEAATLRKDIERQLAELESPQATQDAAAGLRERLAAAIEAEARLTAASQRGQMRVDAFRTRKEVLKAAYTAARAEQLIEQAQDADAVLQDDPAAGRRGGGLARRDHRPDPEGAGPGCGGRGPDGAPAGRARRQRHPHLVRRRAARHRAADRRAGRTRRRAGPLPRSRPPRLRGPARGADRTLGPGRGAGARTFADAPSFLEEFFPGRVDEFSVGAAALVAANRARTLAEQRIRLGLTQAQVAARMGVRQERVSAIERAEPGATEIRTLAGYVEALGGRLDIIADFGAERILLR